MAIKIRLKRGGMKKSPIYRIVAIESQAARDGRYLEVVGTYNPSVNPPLVSFEGAALDRWLANGAQPSATVARLIRDYKRAPK